MRIYFFTDLETSGLDPVLDRIVEVGWLFADAKLRRITETSYAVVRPVGAAIDRILTTPVVKAMHERTGLLQELQANPNLPLLQAVEVTILDEMDQIELAYQNWRATLEPEAKMHPDVSDHVEFVIAGKNVYFDKGFIDRYMPRLSARLSHRTFDERSLTYLLDAMGIGMNVVPDEISHGLTEHRAGFDVELTFTAMRFVLETVRSVHSGTSSEGDAFIVDSANGEFRPLNIGDAVEEDLRRMNGE